MTGVLDIFFWFSLCASKWIRIFFISNQLDSRTSVFYKNNDNHAGAFLLKKYWWYLCLCCGFRVSVGHKYLSLGRPEGKPISFYHNKKAVYTFLHLVGRINLGAFYSKSSKTFGENIFKNIRWEKVNSKNFLRDGVLLIPSKDVFQLLIKPSLELKATIKPSMFWLKLYELWIPELKR